MPEEELKKIADKADFIVAGYSFTKEKDGSGWVGMALL